MKIAERYESGKQIGIGGMGTVYRGTDSQTGETVAVKHLQSDIATPEMVERFSREGEALRQLNHPNIVKMLDAVQENDQHYLIMELVSGGSLRESLDKTPQMPVKRVLEIALDLCDALTRAHRLDIIHRDIKPANVLIAEDGTPRLTDFGIARTGKSEITETGAVMGTTPYISPELLSGDAAGVHSDIWALGVMFFEMLAGERPFQGDNPGALITAILTAPHSDLEGIRPDTPIALVDLVYRMLVKNPAERIPSVRLVGAELEAILQGRDMDTTPSKMIEVTPGGEAGVFEPGRFATPTPTAGLVRHNLPAQTTPFVGREAELEELQKMLANPDIRLVTILAPGGMGKTRLSLEIAGRYAALLSAGEGLGMGFPDGVFFVELAPLADSANIVAAIANAVGYSFQGDEREPKQQILDCLREKRLLLVVDNFEHVLDGAPIVTEILGAAPGIKIIATSRQRLNQSGENIFNLHGMGFPKWETPEDALEFAAIKLFLQSARRVQPEFEITEENMDYVARICISVQGMPLGILLAAGWLTMLSPEEIAGEIQSSIDFLETEMTDIPERQRSIRAVFEYSWNLMTETEQESLMKLAVFRGGFTREAAQEVAEAGLRTLMSLINRSLIRRDAESGRYEMHELLRRHAEERLAGTDPSQNTHDTHSVYYLAFLQQRTDSLKDARQEAALKEIDTELENVRAAWKWAIKNNHAAPISQALESLAIYYQLRHYYQEGETVLANSIDTLVSPDQTLVAQLQAHQSKFLYHQIQYERTQEVAGRALEAARESGDEKTLAIALQTSGAALYLRGEVEEGLKHLEESKRISNALGELWITASTLHDMAYARQRKGDTGGSFEARKERLAVAEKLGIPSLKANALIEISVGYLWQGKLTEAKSHCEEGLALSQKTGNQADIAYAHYALGIANWWSESFEDAERVARAGLELFKELNVGWGIAWTQLILGLALGQLGQVEKGEPYLQQALTSFKTANNQFGIAIVLANLGVLENLRDAIPAVRRYLHESLQVAQSSGSVPVILADLHVACLLRLKEDAEEQAVEFFTLIVEHPATIPYDRNAATRYLANLEETLPPDIFAPAQERGKSLDLETVIKELIEEFKKEES